MYNSISSLSSRLILAAILATLVVICAGQTTYAGSARWRPTPINGDWNRTGNWTPRTVPNGPSDVATFATSSSTAVSLSTSIEVNGIVFDPGASAFTITATAPFSLRFSGTGVTNNSGITQSFVGAVNASGQGGAIYVDNNATAGAFTSFTTTGGLISGGDGTATYFSGTASAGSAAFLNNGGVAGAEAGYTLFDDNSTAENGLFTNNGGVFSDASGGSTNFFVTATASNGTFNNKGGSVAGAGGGGTFFYETSGCWNLTPASSRTIPRARFSQFQRRECLGETAASRTPPARISCAGLSSQPSPPMVKWWWA